MTIVDESLDPATVERILRAHGTARENAIPVLHALQREYGYLPRAALREVCARSAMTPAQLTGLATFYTQFRLRPAGKHTVSVCCGTACHVKGAGHVVEAFRRALRLAPGEDTDPARRYTVQEVACLGCCTLAPVVQIDEVTYGHVTPARVEAVLDDFAHRQAASDTAAAPGDPGAPAGEIRIGIGSCCIANGSAKVRAALERTVNAMAAPVRIKPVGCVGMCHQAPLLEVQVERTPPVIYAKVDPADVPAILQKHFRPRGAWRRIAGGALRLLDALLTDEGLADVEEARLDPNAAPVCDFLSRQVHIATEQYGRIDPLDLAEYRRCGGFAGLDAARGLAPETILEMIDASGLRGRGGAGYPTGRKWRLVREAADAAKYIVLNGDEGDPGAFMDRMLLESFPYRILEGMAIAARAVGAREGWLYIRAEYPLAVQRVRAAIDRCEQEGLLDDLTLRVMEGAGAFVCGEETALLASLQGGRGSPRLRPPYPAAEGLFGKPTLINNVETFACVPWILREGAEAFSAHGTPVSPGTKVFALTGKVARGGLVEVPMGITVGEIVEGIGGVETGAWKAVQVGGPAGGCLPASMADTPVDFEALARAGAIMGSGGFVVLGHDDCMVEMARYFLRFTQEQSCGRCTFCRVGTRRMLEILDRLCEGRARAHDLDRLDELAAGVVDGALCGLGRNGPNPVLTTLRYFREEYEAHLQGRCPAGKCAALIRYRITDRCIGCTRCAQVCPVEAIPVDAYRRHAVDDTLCTRCGLCRGVCPQNAIEVESP